MAIRKMLDLMNRILHAVGLKSLARDRLPPYTTFGELRKWMEGISSLVTLQKPFRGPAPRFDLIVNAFHQPHRYGYGGNLQIGAPSAAAAFRFGPKIVHRNFRLLRDCDYYSRARGHPADRDAAAVASDSRDSDPDPEGPSPGPDNAAVRLPLFVASLVPIVVCFL